MHRAEGATKMKLARAIGASILASFLCAVVLLFLTSIAPAQSPAAVPGRQWTITLEEPTGIYRRDQEVVNVRMTFSPGAARTRALRLFDTSGKPLQTQVVPIDSHPDGSLKTAEILFLASIIPGERPQFRLVSESSEVAESALPTTITARRIGTSRIEMGNERFGVILNLGLEQTEPALVAAYNRTAGEMRMVNLIETSPDVAEPLTEGRKSAGFGTFLGSGDRRSAFDRVEILESGPMRGRVRLSGARHGARNETWEFVWYANSPVLNWRASIDEANPPLTYGFFFSCISARPYLPFDRWMEGVELRFPDGWETDHPPDHLIGGRNVKDLEGGHIVYYQREENYGAIGIFESDASLEWKGAGARQFSAATQLSSIKRSTEIAISFPRWKGTETVLEARKEYRIYRQPILSVASSPQPREDSVEPVRQSAAGTELRTVPIAELARVRADTTIDLNGKWKLQSAEKADGERLGYFRDDFDDAEWRLVDVPGTVHTQILESPKFYTREAEWISTREWWYRRTFAVSPALREQRLFLAFEATDYYADIYLNGKLIERHEGYIDPYEVEVTNKVNFDGRNQLSIRVWTPVSYYWRHRPYTIKGSYGAVDQKPDKITPVGITRPVRLVARGPVRIEDLAIDTRLNADGSASIVVDVTIDSAVPHDAAEFRLTLAPRNFAEERGLLLRSVETLERGRQVRRFVLPVEQPQLWWTWDHGKPNLYTLGLSVKMDDKVSDERSLPVGIREIEHVDWKFYLNGKRIFIRGTNFYYHLFQSEVRRADYERDFKLMVGMNINMLRLHCNFSNPEFYDLADELGVLVWQDFLEAWYPEDRAFSLKAAALYDNHIKYVRNHPSVAIWATSDEESLENYRDLTKHLEPRLYVNDPQRRPVQRSTGRYGDAHVYEGWYGGTIWAYAKMTEKFVSELGATALPNYDTLMKFIPDAWPIKDHEEEWVFRKLQLTESMRAWGEPGTLTLKEYIPQTQDYVARLFQLAIERMRRLKYQPAGGILHFHAIDLWPSVTMAAIDFYRQPTKSYTTVQRSFQMVLPSFAYDRDTWRTGEGIKTELWVINDHLFGVPSVRVSWRLVGADGTVSVRGEHKGKLDLAPDSTIKLLDVAFPAGLPGKYTLWATVAGADGKTISENSYEFKVQRETEAQKGGQ
ncbi:MAG: sugar-binding domain-containing protein [Acidobacteriota bacterium]